jgi:hypothetical protein
MLNLSDKVKTIDLLKGGMNLVEVVWCYGKNESIIHSIWDKKP